MATIAIIGASIGQLPLCLKAKERKLTTICFAYEKGAVCKDVVDYFFPISIMDKERIVEICRQYNVDGIISNTSEITAQISSYIAQELNLIGTPYEIISYFQDKSHVRIATSNIDGLSQPIFYIYDGKIKDLFPCVIKPCVGSSKKGVSYVVNHNEFSNALNYALQECDDILVEQFVDGNEISVECLSFKADHYILQFTDKDSSGPPHFVELGHHQPSQINKGTKNKLCKIIPQILNSLGYTNGASHIEFKIKGDDIYLIEVNLRGGGDDISNKLVLLSSGIDYLGSMIDVALGNFKGFDVIHKPLYSGVYLCKQTSELLPFFLSSVNQKWCIESKVYSTELENSLTNYNRNGYLIYQFDKKIIP